MLVRQFLHYMKSAPVEARVEAVIEFSRLFLDNAIAAAERPQADAALVLMLDDPALAVRRAMAQVLGPRAETPYAVISGLMHDDPLVSAIVARHSPLLFDGDLLDLINSNSAILQIAIADRTAPSTTIAAALADQAGVEACLALLGNETAALDAASLNRIVERHGHDSDIRDALLRRPQLPVETQQALIVHASEALAASAKTGRRHDKSARDACDRATLALARHLSGNAPQALIRHLITTGQMTASFLLRVILTGNMGFFEASLAELTGYSAKRVASLVHDRRGAGFKALYDAAGLPYHAYPAFAAALDGWHEDGMAAQGDGDSRMNRRMVERALTASARHAAADSEQLLILLRRFEAEALRDEAKHLAEGMQLPQLVEAPPLAPVADGAPMIADAVATTAAGLEAPANEPDAATAASEAMADEQQIAEIHASAARIQHHLQQLIAERTLHYARMALPERQSDRRWTEQAAAPQPAPHKFVMPQLGNDLHPDDAQHGISSRTPRPPRRSFGKMVRTVDPSRLFVA